MLFVTDRFYWNSRACRTAGRVKGAWVCARVGRYVVPMPSLLKSEGCPKGRTLWSVGAPLYNTRFPRDPRLNSGVTYNTSHRVGGTVISATAPTNP